VDVGEGAEVHANKKKRETSGSLTSQIPASYPATSEKILNQEKGEKIWIQRKHARPRKTRGEKRAQRVSYRRELSTKALPPSDQKKGLGHRPKQGGLLPETMGLHEQEGKRR